MRTIVKIIDLINEWLGRLLSPILALLAIVVLYDVAMRYIAGRPSDWAFYVATGLFGAHFMLVAAYGLRHRVHIEVDVVKRLLSSRRQAVVEIAGYVLFFIPFAYLLLYFGWAFAERLISRLETTPGMADVPIWPVKLTIVIAGVLLVLQAVAIVLRAIQHLRGKPIPELEEED